MHSRNNKALFFMLSGLCLLTITPFLNSFDNWLVDILSNFPVQYAVAALLLMIVSLRKRQLPLTLFAGFLFIFNISVLSDSGASVQAAAHEHETFTLYSANIQKTNMDFPKLVTGLKKADADILLLLEVTEKSIEPLQSLILTYPYHFINLNVGASGTGAVLMSKFPILGSKVTKYSEYGNMLVRAMIEINNKKVMFYGVHLPRPAFAEEYSHRSEQALSLAEQISRQSIPVILAGDINASPFSPIFKRLIKRSGLKDSRTGFGWQPSWPTYFPVLWIPIDHILVSPGIKVHNRTTGPHLGSDHFPVIAELSIG